MELQTRRQLDNSIIKLFVLYAFHLTFIPSECRKIDQIDNRLKLLEKKFAIHSYENALLREEFIEMKDKLREIENGTAEVVLKMGETEDCIEPREIQEISTDPKELATINSAMSILLRAFQTEKKEQQILKGKLQKQHESHQIDKKKMEAKIDQLASKQGELEHIISEQAKKIEESNIWMINNFDMMNESVKAFLSKDIMGHVEYLQSEMDNIGGFVRKNTEVIASTEDRYNSISTVITSLSARLSQSKVSFFARRSKSISDLGPWSTLVFNDVVVNLGNAYSKTTGVFTAPANGVYLFFTHILGGDRALEMSMQKNGQNVMWLYADGKSYGQDGNMAVLNLVKGDTIKVVKHGPWGSRPFYIHPSWTNFAGTMLYPL